MRLDTPHARLELRKNDVATLRNACRATLDCLDGVAWITIDHDPRDVVLTRGQSFVVDSGAKVLVCAIRGEAVVDVRAPVRSVGCAPARPRVQPRDWTRWLPAGWQPRTA